MDNVNIHILKCGYWKYSPLVVKYGITSRGIHILNCRYSPILSHCASMIFGVSLSPKKWWRNLWMVPKVILLWRVLLNAVVGRKNLGLSFCKFVKIWSASILLFWWGWCIGVGTKYKWSSMAVRLDCVDIFGRIFIGWKFTEIL